MAAQLGLGAEENWVPVKALWSEAAGPQGLKTGELSRRPDMERTGQVPSLCSPLGQVSSQPRTAACDLPGGWGGVT